MKLLIVNNRPPHCGIGEYTFSLYGALKKLLGDDAELMSWQAEVIEKIYSRVREHYILQYPEEAMRILSQFIFLLRIPHGYTVYHFTNSSLSLDIKRVRPCVVTVHDLIPFNAPRDLTDRLIRKSMRSLRHAQRIICVSQKTRSDLLRFLDIRPERVRIIYEGVNHDLFRPRDRARSREVLGIGQNKLMVLHVGSEEPRKNIPALVEAFCRLQRDVGEAVLVRVGEKTAAVQRQIDSLKLNDKVLYFQNTMNLEYFYNAADMLVFPSFEEGFGFPPLQAMASGCPVIASNTTSIPEVVGDAGILLDPADAAGLAHWMREVYVSRELKSSLIEKGLRRSQMFSWEKVARETVEVYREAIS
ncbi:MAG: hypothetical protein A2144_03850 [Chloroflexi bacterium RBG_16_50_9]|nr:MAG: hypothetical protein A2144_03850 [Chloroflexi bacterium RBG_16_50_9]